MSGAAGLSAAKRRRGGNGGFPPPQIQQRQPPPGAQPPAPPPGHVQISPMKILENHEIRLNNLDQHLQDIIESFGTQDGTATDETLVFFRDKTIQLEKKIEELEGLLHKVQTFSMETNTMVLKSNNALELVLDDGDGDVLSEYDGSPDDNMPDDDVNSDVGEISVDEPIEFGITG
jgi:hypothetical protein